MRRRVCYGLFFVASLWIAGGAASAQGRAPASASDADARALFNLGQSAYEEGRYSAALNYFQQSYDQSHRPQLWFNIGLAADRSREDRRALEAFESYLREVPNAPQRSTAEARIAVLRTAIAAQESRTGEASEPAGGSEPLDVGGASPAEEPASAVSTTEAEPRDASSPNGRLGWSIAGGGGAALAIGTVFFALGLHDKSTVENAAYGSTYASVADEYERASRRVALGAVLLGVGAAAGATGLVLALREQRSSDAPVALELRLVPGGVWLRGTF